MMSKTSFCSVRISTTGWILPSCVRDATSASVGQVVPITAMEKAPWKYQGGFHCWGEPLQAAQLASRRLVTGCLFGQLGHLSVRLSVGFQPRFPRDHYLLCAAE